MAEWFERNPVHKARYLQIVAGDAGFSLREIDHFVTNMSARRPMVFVNHEGRIVDVNLSYKDMLRCFHKNRFDSFRRRGGGELKQLNFFKWAIETGVVDFAVKNIEAIRQDMRAKNKDRVEYRGAFTLPPTPQSVPSF